MPERVYWTRDTPDLFCASILPTWGVRRYLVVEAMPDGGWDWAAWESGVGGSQHGCAGSEGDAMLAAEEAARGLRSGPPAMTPPIRLHVVHAAPM